MNKVFKIITSIKTAIILIAVIIILSGIATLIPQDQPESFYLKNFAAPLNNLILTLHFHTFFRSILFFIPCILFFINLAGCTFRRIVNRIKARAPLRPGPDILHIGILLVLIGGVISIYYHREAFIMLREGEEFLITGTEKKVVLKDFQFLTYPDGRPKDWISGIEISENEKPMGAFSIEVNHPVRIGEYRMYQSSYEFTPTATLALENHDPFLFTLNEGFQFEGTKYSFTDYAALPDGDGLITIRIEKENHTTETKFRARERGVSIGPFQLKDFSIVKKSGLQVVYDPAGDFIMLSLIVIMLGLIVTFYQRIGDQKE